jgi:hypothetical protein
MQRMTARFVSYAAVAILMAITAPPGTAQQDPASAPRAATRPAAEVLARLGESAGVVILADSTVLGRLPVQTTSATADAVETRLAELVRLLPAGTTWVKLYAPTPVNGRWVADTVADYARAQIRLLGTTVRPAPAGTVEIMGRYVPAAKAGEYISALNLKLVYLVTNPQAPNPAHAAANWSGLTPEQRQMYADQQAQRILALDPESRLQALASMMMENDPRGMIMTAVFKRLPAEQRGQIKEALSARMDRIKEAKSREK